MDMSETIIATIPNKPQLNEEITLTEKAAAEIKRIKAQNNIPEANALRVGVKGGGCSGLSYVLGFDSDDRKGDKVFELHGITVRVDPKSLFYLSGTELDFSDGLNGKGFVFNNPNANKTCGCGSSFSA
jgi:iron-sulfur cluster assembly protein